MKKNWCKYTQYLFFICILCVSMHSSAQENNHTNKKLSFEDFLKIIKKTAETDCSKQIVENISRLYSPGCLFIVQRTGDMELADNCIKKAEEAAIKRIEQCEHSKTAAQEFLTQSKQKQVQIYEAMKTALDHELTQEDAQQNFEEDNSTQHVHELKVR